jgi:phosphopantetheine--protein transferase-like protein
MIIGIGTDILHRERLSALDGLWDDSFFVKTFTMAEREAALATSDPLGAFCSGFCAKEAVFKALRVHSDTMRLDEVEILHDEYGLPKATLHKNVNAAVSAIHVSVSHEANITIAFAVIEDGIDKV